MVDSVDSRLSEQADAAEGVVAGTATAMGEQPQEPVAVVAAAGAGAQAGVASGEGSDVAGQTAIGGVGAGAAEIDLNALINVPVTLTVEIGRSRMPIKQLINLTQGSVVELDKAVDESLDLLVNGTLIARGEVVVMDGQFGLRLTGVVSQAERLQKLK